MINKINDVFQKDLDTLSSEISKYEKEEDLWKVEDGINNCAGNLCLHICGNLKHFIGAVLGNSGYVRERDREFNDKNVPKSELLKNIEETKESLSKTLQSLDESILNTVYPINVLGPDMNTGFFIIHLCGHLNYHLGQINYHRRLLTSSK